MTYRWFTDPAARRIYPEQDHAHQSRIQVASLRAALTRQGNAERHGRLIAELIAQSPEFAELWAQHEVEVRTSDHKVILHPELGPLELDCQLLLNENQSQVLLIFTATPGTESDQKLRLLGVIGSQRLRDDADPSPLAVHDHLTVHDH